jgi:hypothetical protein
MGTTTGCQSGSRLHLLLNFFGLLARDSSRRSLAPNFPKTFSVIFVCAFMSLHLLAYTSFAVARNGRAALLLFLHNAPPNFRYRLLLRGLAQRERIHCEHYCTAKLHTNHAPNCSANLIQRDRTTLHLLHHALDVARLSR